MWINIIFHRIAVAPEDIQNDYELTEDQFVERVNATRIFADESDTELLYRFYFDDGDNTFLTIAKKYLKEAEYPNTVLGIVTDNMNTSDHLSSTELKKLADQGFVIASHSASHPALAFYENGTLLPTTSGGNYQTSPFGHTKILSKQEVLFQLTESYKRLEEAGLHGDEFVLPHGCYNKQTIQLVNQTELYKTISTCDPFLDTGTNPRPRLLTRHNESLEAFKKHLSSLQPQPKNYGQ